MRRKKNKANQNVILQGYPFGLLIEFKQLSGSPRGTKFAQIFIIIDELRTGL